MFGERGYGRNEEKKEKNPLSCCTCHPLPSFCTPTMVSLRNRTGEEIRQILCGTSVTVILFENNFRQHFYLSYLLSYLILPYLKEQVSNSLVTFVTLKRFAVLFFLPSCCVNSLMLAAACTDTRARLSLHIVLVLQTNLKLLICIY